MCCKPYHDVSQLYEATWQHVVTYRDRLCRVVKHKSCETYWILLRRLMTTHVSFEVTDSQSRRHLIVTNWAAERLFTSVNIVYTQVNDLSAAQFVAICRRDCDLKRHMRRHSRLLQSMLNTSADHLNDQLTITVSFLSHRIFIPQTAVIFNQSVCVLNLFFIHCILSAVNDINWATRL